MHSPEKIEVTRTWERQRLAVIERSPALYQEIRCCIDEGKSSVEILNLIDAALDCTPTSATVISAATQAFDSIRSLVSTVERDAFLRLLTDVNRQIIAPLELKKRLHALALTHHATALLEGIYFDDVRGLADDAG